MLWILLLLILDVVFREFDNHDLCFSHIAQLICSVGIVYKRMFDTLQIVCFLHEMNASKPANETSPEHNTDTMPATVALVPQNTGKGTYSPHVQPTLTDSMAWFMIQELQQHLSVPVEDMLNGDQ